MVKHRIKVLFFFQLLSKKQLLLDVRMQPLYTTISLFNQIYSEFVNQKSLSAFLNGS